GPPAMGTIPRIAAHLDLDGAGIATGPALGEHEERELVEQRLESSRERAGGRVPRRMPKGPDGEEGVAIAQAHRGHAGARRRAAHDEADEVVGEQQAPDFLLHAGGRFAAQRFDAFAGVSLEFVEGEFEFPALVVEGGELRGGVGGGGGGGGGGWGAGGVAGRGGRGGGEPGGGQRGGGGAGRGPGGGGGARGGRARPGGGRGPASRARGRARSCRSRTATATGSC